jgi:hypothetical protein
MDSKNYKWLLDNRNRIQQLILELFNYQDEKEAEIKNNPVKFSIYLLLVGSVFCLWRAVFLYEAKSKTKFEQANELLKKLIELKGHVLVNWGNG